MIPDLPDLETAPYSEGLRRLLYDAVARIVEPEAGDLVVFYAWGRWFAVWQDLAEDAGALPVSRVWQVARLARGPDGVMLHEV